MKTVTGEYVTAKIFTDLVEDSAINQVQTLMNQEFVDGCKVRMMPDIHSGKGCTIGTTMEIRDKICPNLVGVDIGCGMEVIRIKETFLNPVKFDIILRENIPFASDSSNPPLLLFYSNLFIASKENFLACCTSI